MTISVWLLLGFALVIGAFAVASVVSLRSTRHATVDLGRMQQQFEPLSRSVRDLGDGLATFDRAVLAYLLFNNLAVSTLGSNFTQVVFNFKVTPALVGRGLVIAVVIGMVGGFLPALRAARMPVTTALRAA